MRGNVFKALTIAGVIAAGIAAAVLPGLQGAQASEEPKTYPARVSGEQARKLVAEGAMLVDVRTPAEYAEGHVDGAVNIPFDELAARQSELGAKDKALVIYCRSGRRTAIGAKTLQALGYTKVYDLGSISRW